MDEIRQILNIRLVNNDVNIINNIISYMVRCSKCNDLKTDFELDEHCRCGYDSDDDDNYVLVCDDCNETCYCDECGKVDITDDKEYDVKICEVCDDTRCNNCSYNDCNDCNKRWCNNCIGVYWCIGCNENACLECRSFIRMSNNMMDDTSGNMYCSDCYTTI